jgi:purine-binding chemotaxis protein CheW
MAAARQLCTFFVGDGYFGIPVEQVQEVVRPQPITPVPLAPRVVRGLINLRGQILTAIDLRRRLNVPESLGDQLPLNVVVRTADGALSLLVDEIGDVVEVLEDTFERCPETLQGVSRELILGVHKLPQGLLLVLDTEKVVNVLESDALVPGAEA